MADDVNALPLRVASRTLGCRLNQCDSDAVVNALRRHCPIRAVGWHEAADLYLLASCTVTAKATQECRRLVRQVKKSHPAAKVVVTGCYAQIHPDELAAMPEIDGILGQTAKMAVSCWLPALLEPGGRPILVEPLTERGPLAPVCVQPIPGLAPRQSRAHLKVQDGCDLRCTYCQIWKARGPARSLPPEAAAHQVRTLHAELRYPEVVLTGINLGAWGSDLNPARSLPDLLSALGAAAPGLRVRLSSLHPGDVTPALVSLVASRRPHLRPHLHLALQSGSDSVLERMGRPYRREQALAAAAELKRHDPLAGLGADLIVGFPAESDAEFQETVEFCQSLPLTYLHVFRFSPRPGTPAAARPPVPADIVRRRAKILRQLGKAKGDALALRLVGEVREAVLERGVHRPSGARRATLDNYAVAFVDSDLPPGTLLHVRMTAVARDGVRAAPLQVILEGRR